MSIMVGTGRGATAGVLIRNAEALERLEKVDTLVVDKTGTLTEGKPKLVSATDDEILRLAASVEKLSEHPLAAAIVAGARSEASPWRKRRSFNRIPGRAWRATVDGHRVFVGNARRVPMSQRSGQIVVYVTIDGQAAGTLGVGRPGEAIGARSDRASCIAMACASSC